MKFGENLKNIRKSKNISQEYLAEKLGVSRQSVSKWETGENFPSMNNIMCLCEIFKCKINDLVHEDFTDIESLDSEIRLENLMEFRSVSENYEKVTGNVNLGDFLAEVSLVADATEYSEDSDAITLMTIHSAKGLEFKVVFIVGLEENIMPISKALYDESELEEERRLMYVAITRAKDFLIILINTLQKK